MLIDDVLDESNLIAAWDRVRRNKGGPGVDGQTIEQFGCNVFGRLQTLRQQVVRKEYAPKPLLEIRIPKRSGGERRLAVPVVRDRILQTACNRILAPLLESEFEGPSFAYRVGRSVPMAVARVAWYRDQGYQWVVDADIQSFFDEVDHDLLRAKLRRTLTDHSLLPLIDLWLTAVVQPHQGQPYLLTRGIPQGSPISPLLANLYLDDLDEALIDQNLRFVRFADDFLILCRDRVAAEQALEITGEVLEALKLRFRKDKTRLTHFDEGFRFLGVDFIRNLLLPAEKSAAAWVLPDDQDLALSRQSMGQGAVCDERETDEVADELHNLALDRELEGALLDSLREPLASRLLEQDQTSSHDGEEMLAVMEENPVLEPLLRTLYVTRQGLRLHKDGERLLIAEGERVVLTVPLHKVDQVVVQGNQLVSTALLDVTAQQEGNVVFLDMAGRFIGQFQPNRNRNLELERCQYERDRDESFKLMMARACVAAKIHNARVVLRRFSRRRDREQIGKLEEAMAAVARRLPVTENLNQVRGVEGAAAHAYFQALARLLPDEWGFPGRRRRPPTDPFNVLLSYGYGVLFHTMHTLVQQRGLNAWLGSLHSSDGRHQSLVSDLIEEFRAVIVDVVALNALLHNLKPEDFDASDERQYPCRIRDIARRNYLRWLQNKFRSLLLHPRSRQRVDYHRILQGQVWHYARVVLGQEPVYLPYKAR